MHTHKHIAKNRSSHLKLARRPNVSRAPPRYTDLVRGHLDYMAPEICWRRPYGPAVDVWSAGVVMHVLLSGEAPWGVGRTPHPVSHRCGRAAAVQQHGVAGRELRGALAAERPAGGRSGATPQRCRRGSKRRGSA